LLIFFSREVKYPVFSGKIFFSFFVDYQLHALVEYPKNIPF